MEPGISHLAVFAVSNEQRAGSGPDKEAAAGALVDGDGCKVIEQVNVAVDTRINEKLLSVNRAEQER